jgi:Importin repeat
VTGQVTKIFTSVAAAIEADSIQGKTLTRVVESTRKLLAGLPPGEAQRLFTGLTPKEQAAVAEKFNK